MGLECLLKRLLGLGLMVLAIALPQAASAQSVTANWSSAGVGSINAMPNPTTITASDGTSVQLNYGTYTNGGTFTPVYDNSFVGYYSGQVGDATGVAVMAFDNGNWDTADKVTATITLGRAVTGLAFSINDINRAPFGEAFRDVVTVEYDTGSGSFQNLAGNSSYWTAGSAISPNGSNFVGESSTSLTSTAGTLQVDFGGTTVTRIRITFNSDSYRWFDASQPTAQQIGISGLAFNPVDADLSLANTRVSAIPTNGGSVTWRLTVSNAANSMASASGVTVEDYLPSGFTFTSASGVGSFNASTGLWTLGTTLAPGDSASIDITGTISATPTSTITNAAEIMTSSVIDRDSTPGNGAAGEDDYASNSFTVAGTRGPGVAPALTCPAGSVLFDWDPKTWTAGSTSNSYQLDVVGQVAFQLTNPGVWLSDSGLGGLSPTLQSTMNGGKTGEKLLTEFVNLPNQTARVTTQITLPMIMRGAQFMIADVDYASGQFADLVTVEGRYQGATVIPTLTNGVANYVIGNSAYGDASSTDPSSDGNVIVTFNQSIDQIIIKYGDHSLAPSDPGQQAIAIHDILFCRPTTTLVTTKTSTLLSDLQNGTNNPKMIPGAIVEYCILVRNTGDTAATNVTVGDPLPAGTSYISGSMTSGSSCASASTVEDDDNSGADESDPFGGSVNGSTLTVTAASLSAGEAMAIKFRSIIN